MKKTAAMVFAIGWLIAVFAAHLDLVILAASVAARLLSPELWIVPLLCWRQLCSWQTATWSALLTVILTLPLYCVVVPTDVRGIAALATYVSHGFAAASLICLAIARWRWGRLQGSVGDVTPVSRT